MAVIQKTLTLVPSAGGMKKTLMKYTPLVSILPTHATFWHLRTATRWMEIDKTLFDAFNEFELDDLSFFNEVDRHYERSEVTEATLNRRAAKPQESVEEIVSQQMEVDKLHRAIAQLPEKQRRRLVLYYFGEFTYEQIADMEGCKLPAVMKSISSALKKLKNFLSGEVTI